MRTAILIVAAGRGTRARGALPKQWQDVAGRPVARWTLEAMSGFGSLAMVIHPEDQARAEAVCAGLNVRLVQGGAERSTSVRNGLEALSGEGFDAVLIHDVARPCVPAETVQAVLDALQTAPAAAPSLAVTDALWTAEDGHVSGTRDRSGLFRAQTPQGFHFDGILAAHRAFAGVAADDVEVARAAGIEVRVTPGSERNIKITTPEDFSRASKVLRGTMDVRTGNGYDVHAFEEGDHVILCGVRIPHNRKLKGHSDADVGMHAVTDALYGALAEGDIGRHFPPSDPQWKGAASEIFLKHAVDLARTRGFRIGNVDLTLICERPKIGPHAAEMTKEMSRIMNLEPDRISIKATTSERLGFTGREEGIAAIATATLVSI
ncbi:bifunctional 2-C-methyl-D-erythritol 4-phosphate cytidylyltransferase/2-C-methyl-D-erythritol 2,4-cyclodiphosphate synthase [Sagittula sp. P11]|uniref:bifunctional 2-C-methyl-D-erythritol 4-phosphate cytidylyltransferase/2-C-methyl-D-erythritol 2,4-cyclodiphosphate synthase n=1 Tax=Sagittula sp. P11 TaxID=2009329 RepID=UPI000C2D2BAA|nr:bifunctional 2-C-methyl-D-erythritol 4-phosphate cytidylyltransferase/2-C-methyl-D-erythritol 2,4-cyclodiphosphate synthase [Sagittula sp. P11]AUC55637.1 bifunctional 2-C-methyl-D-erythritol 4-phosphate cytidylyltransferase/2-C-methyl-D-erythritol 2,4-cyclodiphosphate synthase [Sagittula sp. P11]